MLHLKLDGKVLELGPGNKPFLKATYFCGHSEEVILFMQDM
jgi:hypothetical protein